MLRIAQGRVYDPANGVDGEVRDVCLDDGAVVAELPSHAPRIDARGMVVMPGGVDIHSHIAGPKINAARKLIPEEHRADVLDRTAITRSGTGGTVPSTFATVHAPAPAVGALDATTLPPPTATHRDVDEHETAFRALSPGTLVIDHADAPPVGFVEVRMLP